MFSLSFLNAGILFLSTAIIIPILIYLFAKKRPKKLIFSSIRFIKLSQKQQRKKINLKNIILLLIRILIILFTVLAISRPSIRSPYLSRGTSHPKTAVAIIIDNSYSMDYLIDTRTQLEVAKNTAIEINELLSVNDVTLLLTMDQSWNDIHGSLRYGKLPTELIRNIHLSAVISPLEKILEDASEKLKESHLPNQEIYVLTDLQEQPLPDKMTIPTFLIGVSGELPAKSNISCENALVVNEIVGDKSQRKIRFELVNHGTLKQDDIITNLTLNGHKTAEKVIDLNPDQRKTGEFEILFDKAGWYTGFVQVKNERLMYDNRNYFTYYYNPEPKVAIISDLSDIPLTLSTILEIYSGKATNLEILNNDDLNYNTLAAFDNFIVYRKELNPRLSLLLDELQQKGKGILFIADPELSLKWQEKLAEVFALRFNKFEADQETVVTFINPYHPITTLFKDRSDITFGNFWSVEADSDILIQAGAHPLVLENERQILWLFDIADLRNPFLLDSTFPVLSYNCLQFMISDRSLNTSFTVGEKIRIRDKEVILPDGNMILWNQEKYTVNRPGIYYFDQKPAAINLDYSESSLRELEIQNSQGLKILRENWETEILRSRYGFEIWKYLLIAVLILFIFEMLLVKSEEKK